MCFASGPPATPLTTRNLDLGVDNDEISMHQAQNPILLARYALIYPMVAAVAAFVGKHPRCSTCEGAFVELGLSQHRSCLVLYITAE